MKLIKRWLPEAGLCKIKVVSKQTVGDYVQAESRQAGKKITITMSK